MPTTADYVSLATLSTLTAGTTYTALVSVKRASDAPTIKISASGTLSSTIVSTSWIDVSVTFVATGSDYLRLIPQTNAGGQVYVDKMQIVEGTTAGTFFDGSASAAGDFTYAWSGTANASTSLQKGLSVPTSANAGVSGGTAVRSQSQYRTGTSSVIVNATAMDSGVETSYITSLASSYPYTASVWVKGETGKSVYLKLEELTGSTSVGSTSGTPVVMDGTWQRVSATRSFGSTGIRAKISILNGSTSTQTFYYDNLMLEQSPIVQDYFDGTNTSTDSDLTIVWSGTANASTSVLKASGSDSYSGYNGAGVVSVTSRKYAGSRSAKVYYSYASSALDNGLSVSKNLQGSTVYTASAWVYTPTGSPLPRFSVRGAGFTEVLGSAATTYNAWERISVTFTTTDTQSYNISLLNSAAAPVDSYFYADNMLIENSPILREYFDGTSGSVLSDIQYSWSGTANASTSVLTAPAVTTYIPVGDGTEFGQTKTDSYSSSNSVYVIAVATNHGLETENSMLVSTSTSYTASAWVKGEVGKNVAITVSEYTTGGSLVGTTTGQSTTMTGAWQLINVTRDFGSTGVRAKVSVLNKTSGVHSMFVDAVMLTDSTYPGTYFDGSLTDAGGLEFAWTGSADSSSSTITTANIYARNLITNPSMETVSTGTTVLRTNLITNPDMEVSPWSDYADGSNVSSSTTEAKNGLQSTKITPIASGVHGASYTVASVVPDNVYTFSIWANRESGSSSMSAKIQWMNGATPLTASTQSFTPAPLGEWSRLYVTGTAPATATSAVVSAVFDSAVVATDVAYVDAALFEQTDQLRGDFSGSSSDLLGWAYDWSGTTDDSTSTAKALPTVFRINLVTNPGFEVNTSGWAAVNSSISRTTLQYFHATASLLVSPSGANASATSPLATTRPDATHIASVWVKGTVGDILRLDLNERTAAGAALVGTTSSSVTLTGSWQRVSVTRAFGATGATATVAITNTSSTALYFVDAVMLEESATLLDYFDGGTGAVGDAYIASWTGTTGLSASTLSGVQVEKAGFAVSGTGSAYQTLSSSGNKSVKLQRVDGALTNISGTFIAADNSILAGKTYTLSGKITAGQTSLLNIYLRPSVTSTTEQTLLGTLSLTAGVTTTFRLSGVASRVGTFGSSSGIAISTTNKNPGGTSFTMDELILVEGVYIDEYFDGDNAHDNDHTVSWSGTPHLSTSLLEVNPVSGWSGVAGAYVYQSSQQTKTGGFSGKVVCSGAQAMQGVGLSSDPAASASSIYTASAWVLAESGKNIQIAIQEKTSSGHPVGTTYSSPTLATGSWQRLSVTRSFGSTAAKADVHVYNIDATPHIMYIDNVLFELSSSLQDYFDGDTGRSGDFSYAWTGTPHESSSYAYGVGVNAVDGGPGRAIVQSVDWAGTGLKSARIIPTGISALTDTELGMVVAGTGVSGDTLLLDKNQTYTVLATLRLKAAQTGTVDASKARRIWFSKDNGTSVSSSSPASTNAAGSYTHKLVITTDSGDTNTVHLGSGTEAGGGDAWWDSVTIVKGVYSGLQFDGSTADSTDITYIWNGLEDESTSAITTNPVKNWTGTNGSVVYQNSTEKYAGAKAALVSCNGVVGLQGVKLISRASVQPSTQYFASLYVKGEAGKAINIELQEWTAAGTYIGSTTSTNVTATGSWQRISVSRNMGSTAAKANVVVSNIAAVAHTFYVDSVLLEASSNLQSYFDGSYPAAGDFSYSWNGGFDDSPSQYQGASVNAVSSVGSFTVQSAEWRSNGSHSLRIIPTSTSANVSHADLTSFITAGLEPGKTYTVMAKVFRAEEGSVAGALAYQGFVGSTLTQNVTAPISVGAGSQDVKIVFTVGASIEAAYLRIYNNQVKGGTDLWVDDFIIVEGEYLGSYFDGDSDATVGAFPILYQWNGTPHDSTSVRDIGGAIPAGGAAILSPFGDAERVNSTSALEIKYRSGWLG